MLLRTKQRWPLSAHVPLAHLSVLLQCGACKSNIVSILVCNFVLVDRERVLREARSPPDRVWYRGQTEGHNVQLGLLTHSITPVNITHDVCVRDSHPALVTRSRIPLVILVFIRCRGSWSVRWVGVRG